MKTNYEHYKDEIIEAMLNCESCDFKKKYILKTKYCHSDCDSCSSCNSKTKEWLNSEYKEPIKLSKTEYHILKGLDERFKYITRDGLGFIQIHTIEPYKEEIGWDSNDEIWGIPYTHLFQFIKWEDEKPYEIAKLIADYERDNVNEEVEENDMD